MITKKHIGFSVLALSLALSLPAYAQGSDKQPPAPASASMQPTAQPMTGMERRGPMHPEFREEVEKMRKEQEDLDMARDKLLDKCIVVSKEQTTACKKERDELRVRAEKFREDRKAMHEKMETMRKEREEFREKRHEEMKENMGNRMMGPGGAMGKGK